MTSAGQDPDGGCIEATARLQTLPSSPGQARRFVAASLAGWDRSAQVEVVVLLTSEVVTNVVLHAGPHHPHDELVLSIDWTDNRVRVAVSDRHPGTPKRVTAARADGSGRGVLLLDALATAWGMTPSETGKVVWFEVHAASA